MMSAFQALYSEIRPTLVNAALLVEQAAGVFGERLVNVDTGDTRGLGVHLARIEDGDAARWEDLLRAHDGTRQTAGQIEQAQKELDVWRWEETAGAMIAQGEQDLAALGGASTVEEIKAITSRVVSRQVVVMRMLKGKS